VPDDDRRVLGGQSAQERLERAVPALTRDHGEHGQRPVRNEGAPGARLAAGRGGDGLTQVVEHPLHRVLDVRLLDHPDGTVRQGLAKRSLGAAQQRRHDDDGDGAGGHDLLEERQPVHPRHLEVERDDVGVGHTQQVPGRERVFRHADDLDRAVFGEVFCERVPDGHGVVHDQQLGRQGTSRPSPPRSDTRKREPQPTGGA
jgi:hypothetical protein